MLVQSGSIVVGPCLVVMDRLTLMMNGFLMLTKLVNVMAAVRVVIGQVRCVQNGMLMEMNRLNVALVIKFVIKAVIIITVLLAVGHNGEFVMSLVVILLVWHKDWLIHSLVDCLMVILLWMVLVVGHIDGLIVRFMMRFFVVRFEDDLAMDWVLVFVDGLTVVAMMNWRLMVPMVAGHLSVLVMMVIFAVLVVVEVAAKVVMVIRFTVVLVGGGHVTRSVVVNRHEVKMLLVAVMLVAIVLMLVVVHLTVVVLIGGLTDTAAVVEEASQLDVGVGRFFDVVLNIEGVFSSHVVLVASIHLLLLSHDVVSRFERIESGLEVVILSRLVGNQPMFLWGRHLGDCVMVILNRLLRGIEFHKLAHCLGVVVLHSRDVTASVDCQLSVLSSAVDIARIDNDRSSLVLGHRGLLGNWGLLGDWGLLVDWGLCLFVVDRLGSVMNRLGSVMNGLGSMMNGLCVVHYGNRYWSRSGYWGWSRGWSWGRCRLGSGNWDRSRCRCRCRCRCWDRNWLLLDMLLAEGVGNELIFVDNIVFHRTGRMVGVLRVVPLTSVVVLLLRVVPLNVVG